VLFTATAHAGLADGSITRTYRAWKRPQVKLGGRYRVGPVVLVVEALEQVAVADITDAGARRSGFANADEQVAYLRKGSPDLAATDAIWQIDFRAEPPDDAPPLHDDADLSDDDVADIRERLDRLDRSSSHGPWTRQTLATIAEHPATVSSTLAEQLGRDRAELKVDIRKLKRLGLTISLERGYRISPRGQAVLERLAEDSST
jgi:hypothetical protein